MVSSLPSALVAWSVCTLVMVCCKATPKHYFQQHLGKHFPLALKDFLDNEIADVNTEVFAELSNDFNDSSAFNLTYLNLAHTGYCGSNKSGQAFWFTHVISSSLSVMGLI